MHRPHAGVRCPTPATNFMLSSPLNKTDNPIQTRQMVHVWRLRPVVRAAPGPEPRHLQRRRDNLSRQRHGQQRDEAAGLGVHQPVRIFPRALAPPFPLDHPRPASITSRALSARDLSPEPIARVVHRDDCWIATNRTAAGEIQADPARFPDGADNVFDPFFFSFFFGLRFSPLSLPPTLPPPCFSA